jgi:hypothetical protein
MRGALLIVLGLVVLYLAQRGALDCLAEAARCVRGKL